MRRERGFFPPRRRSSIRYWPTFSWSGRYGSWRPSWSNGRPGRRSRFGRSSNWFAFLPQRSRNEIVPKGPLMPEGASPIPTPLAVTLQVIEELRQRQVRPIATYRLQLHRQFTLRDAAAIVPYLHELGVSHVYCSPYLRAKTGSTHG